MVGKVHFNELISADSSKKSSRKNEVQVWEGDGGKPVAVVARKMIMLGANGKMRATY